MAKLIVRIEELFFCSCGNDYYLHKGIRIQTNHQKGAHRGYNLTVMKSCCEEMTDAIDKEIIQLGNDSCLDKPEDKRVNIIRPSWEDSIVLSSINFCPFCGAKIILAESIGK